MHPTNEFIQAPLDDLDADPNIGARASRYTLPDARDLDRQKVEIIVDLDLDEMLLYYYGRHISYDVEPVGELVSYLVEADSERVVGVIVHEFMSRAVREYPSLSQAMRWAIIVSGDKVQPPDNASDDAETGTSERLQPLNQLRHWLTQRLAHEGRERTAELVQALLRTA